MKTLLSKKISPIYLSPGDSLQVTYTPPGYFARRRVLVHHCIEKTQVINLIKIVELEKSDLKALGLKSGLALILGEK